MLKKLQSILFEEEEVIEEEVEYTGATASIPLDKVEEQADYNKAEVQKEIRDIVDSNTDELQKLPSEDLSIPQEVVEEEKKMQRIDVTQATPVVEEAPIKVEEPVVEKPKTLGIMADDNYGAEERPAPRRKPSTKPSKKQERDFTTSYQFQPVISPIFGVDEKDITALKNTTTRILKNEKDRNGENVTPIISPMYGKNTEDVPSSIQKTVEKSNYQEQFRVTADKQAAEDEIPEFSLDDILSSTDDDIPTLDDFVVPTSNDTDSLFPDLWSTELEDAEDSTSIIEHQPTED